MTSPLHPHDVAFTHVPHLETLADILDLSRPHLPDGLIDERHWQRILGRVGRFPAAAATAVNFEFRLGQPAELADILLPIMAGTHTANHLAELGRIAKRDTPADRLGLYCSELANPNSPLHRWITGTILEYDLVEIDPHASPAPGVFIRLRPHSDYTTAAESLSSNVSALAAIVGWEPSIAEQDGVAQAVEGLQPDGQILHIGALPERAERAIRLVACGIAFENLVTVLTGLNWPGSRDAVQDLLNRMPPPVQRVQLAFDVRTSGIGPRIGLELFVDERVSLAAPSGWLATDADDWRPFIDWLEGAGWCLAGKAEGLRNWPSNDQIDTRGVPCRLYRGLNHVKITIDGDSVQNAKAYAGMTFFPLAPS